MKRRLMPVQLLVKVFSALVLLLVLFSVFGTCETESVDRTAREINDAIRAAGADWTAGATSVAKLSEEEQDKLCGAILEDVPDEKKMHVPARVGELPEHFDWRNKDGGDWTTPIRDQDGCGSCWDFSATGVFEALLNIQADDPTLDPDLSEQHILSCCPNCGSCNGGWASEALEFCKTSGNVTEVCQPYQADDTIACDDCGEVHQFIGDWAYIYEDVESLKRAIYYFGPISASFEVYSDFSYYTSGIYEHVSGYYRGGHAIVIVGWDNADQAWICKNSWGTDWGETVDGNPYTPGAGNGGWFRIRWGECNIEGRGTEMATLTSWPEGVVNVTVLDGSGHGVEGVDIYANNDFYGTTSYDGTLALDLIAGMNYEILACSSQHHLLLYGSVLAPGDLVLDCRTASHVNVTARKLDGSALNAWLVFEIGSNREHYYVAHTPNGAGWFYISPDYHNFHVWSYDSEVERYDLVFRDVDLTASGPLMVDASTIPTARWTLDELAGSYDYLRLFGWPTGFRWARLWGLDSGDSLILSADDWSYYRELVDSSVSPYTWYYEGWFGVLYLAGGEEFHISAGGDLTLSTWPEKPEYIQGDTAKIWIELADACGNTYDWVNQYDSTLALPPAASLPVILARPEDESGGPVRSDASGAAWDYFYPWLTVTPPTGPAIFDYDVWLEDWIWIDLDPDADIGTYEVRATQQTHLGELEALSSFDVIEPDPDPYESNDTCETAYDVGSIGHSTPFASDVAHFYDPNEDWFVFGIAEAGRIVIESQLIGNDTDTVIYLYDACSGEYLEYDDDGGPGLASRITYSAAPGTYYLRIMPCCENYGPDTAYTFTIDLVPIPAISVVGADEITLEVPIGSVSTFENLYEIQNIGQPGSELSYRILWQDLTGPAAGGKAVASKPVGFPFEAPSADSGVESTLKSDPPSGDWDLLCFDPDEALDSLMDFAELYAQLDGTTLYFRGITHLPWTNRPEDVTAVIFVDVDQDPSTGWQYDEVGMEYYLQFGPSWGGLWRCDESGSCDYVGPLDYISMPDDANEFVVGVDLSQLGPTDRATGGGFDLQFLGIDFGLDYFEDFAPDVGHLCYPPKVVQVNALPDSGSVTAGESSSIGLQVDGTDPDFFGTHLVRLYFVSNDSTVTPTRDILVTAGEPTPAVFRVGLTGHISADGPFSAKAFLSGSADVAEWVSVSEPVEPVEPGDVLELDPTKSGHYRKSRGPCSTLVAGVVSTDPGFVLGGSATDDSLPTTHAQALLALVGIVPVKVTDEGGPIKPGDLLVASSIPGYAMRWDSDSGEEACGLIGKALESFTMGKGLIKVLLMR